VHTTAFENCRAFFNTYGADIRSAAPAAHVVEIGSQDVNGTLRGIFPAEFKYTGVDFVAGKGVDLVLDDPYSLPLAGESVDVVLSSSCFEHSEMFWVVFLEILRVLKPGGLFYLDVPSNGTFHRYPVDCWRFYPDSGRALVAWARRSGLRPAMLESYTSSQMNNEVWSDYVAVFVKDESLAARYPRRILDSKTDMMNGLVLGSDALIRPSDMTEDLKKLDVIRQITVGQLRVV
jgi:SAM-dependent methyltransferase